MFFLSDPTHRIFNTIVALKYCSIRLERLTKKQKQKQTKQSSSFNGIKMETSTEMTLKNNFSNYLSVFTAPDAIVC